MTIALHWIMLLLIAAAVATIELREIFPRGSDPRELMKAWHFSLGLTVFGLVWVRLLARRARPAAPMARASGGWQHVLASLAHLALYALMIAMPLAGWALLGAEGKPVLFFGLALPPLTGRDGELAEVIEQLHEIGGNILYVLVGVHAAAALAHHYLLRDDTLRRMLPGRRARPLR
jgi:cytochrome b561